MKVICKGGNTLLKGVTMLNLVNFTPITPDTKLEQFRQYWHYVMVHKRTSQILMLQYDHRGLVAMDGKTRYNLQDFTMYTKVSVFPES